jgi:hypothetical protein
MSTSDPAWLPAASEFCRTTGINIVGWGPNLLTLEAKSPDRAREIASQLGQFGLKIVENEDDAYAGLLNLSPDPRAILETERKVQSRYSDFSRRPLMDLLTPALELAFSILFFWVCTVEAGSKSAKFAVMGSVLLLVFLWDGLRIWGWSLQIGVKELRVRRCFAWTAIPWTEIRSIEVHAGGRYQETVTLTRVSNKSVNLGRFDFLFARALRDRLRQQIMTERVESK